MTPITGHSRMIAVRLNSNPFSCAGLALIYRLARKKMVFGVTFANRRFVRSQHELISQIPTLLTIKQLLITVGKHHVSHLFTEQIELCACLEITSKSSGLCRASCHLPDVPSFKKKTTNFCRLRTRSGLTVKKCRRWKIKLDVCKTRWKAFVFGPARLIR